MKNFIINHLILSAIFIILLTHCSHLSDKRNIVESINIINEGEEISEDNIFFILQLENETDKLSYREAKDAQDDSGNYHDFINELIKNNIKKVNATLESAAADSEPVKITFVSGEKDWSDENIVLYVPFKKGFVILTSMDEIKKAIYSSNPYNLDDETINLLQAQLGEARKQNKEFGAFCDAYEDNQNTNKALAIMEVELRKLNAEENGPLLKNGESPKISNAIRDPKILRGIENSNDSLVIWAYSYLSGKKIITKE